MKNLISLVIVLLVLVSCERERMAVSALPGKVEVDGDWRMITTDGEVLPGECIQESAVASGERDVYRGG